MLLKMCAAFPLLTTIHGTLSGRHAYIPFHPVIYRETRILHHLRINCSTQCKSKAMAGHQCKRTYVHREWTLHNFPLIRLCGIITTPLNCVNVLFSHMLCYV